MSSDPRFVHLRVHTEHSLLEGAVRLKTLPGMCRDAGMPAVAVTDTNNMFAALEFSEAAAGAGVQPIMGCQIDVGYLAELPGERQPEPAPLVLLAQNEEGYGNLLKLNSLLYMRDETIHPHVTLDEMQAHSGGLICLSGGPNGPLGRLLENAQGKAAEEIAHRLRSAFGDRLYVEMQRAPDEDGASGAGRIVERGLIELAYAMKLPLVATNDVLFADAAMHEAHDALLCVADGVYVDQDEPRRRVSRERRFKSQEEMAALFADLPEAIENTVEIARRCSFRAQVRDPILPRFADDEVDELRKQAREGLRRRLEVIPLAASTEEYEKRLEYELDVIVDMGFPGYFLIVSDIIKWTKAQGIAVGPGRGSGAGSLVAYALTITDLDPLRYSLLFERFLNPERVSMPDFDIDFCMDRRDEVIAYVRDKYGRDRVAQIITFGGLLSRAAVRDVGRVLRLPYGQVDALSKMIPSEGVRPLSIKEALEKDDRLKNEAKSDRNVDRLLKIGMQVEGLLRNASTHAAGVVIGDRPLDELVPLYRDSRSEMPATQFNMKWVEQAGLVKFDFLGLKTLTAIEHALKQIRDSGRDLHIGPDGESLYEPAQGTQNDISAIPLDDPKTYDLYARAQTVGVFQVESSGMADALKRMKPTCIEDIVALVALYRPGPMENIPNYCAVKNGTKPRAGIHESVDHILDETQGIIVYQEQVMQIAREMAGYSLGGADLLRRAMGKKIKEAMDAERPKFIEGASANGVGERKANEVWELLAKFADYGFNKSHAAAYAVVSYQTAWLKANHPLEFMAGMMDGDITNSDKLAVYCEEVRNRLKLPLAAPCVNGSDATFAVRDKTLRYALGAVRNVGVDAMRLIEEARGDAPFATLFDFARRVDLRRVGRRPLEMLARAGAFDCLDGARRRVLESVPALMDYSAAVHDQMVSGQDSLFGESGEDLPEPRLGTVEDWSDSERLTEEYQAMGFFLSGHPLDDCAEMLEREGVVTLEEAMQRSAGAAVLRMAGIVGGRRERKSAKGSRYAFVQLSDRTGSYEITVFSEVLEASREHLAEGSLVVVTVEAEAEDGGQLKFLARRITPLSKVVANAKDASMRIFVDDEAAVPMVAGILNDAARDAQDAVKGQIVFCVQDADLPGDVEIAVDGRHPASPKIRSAIKSVAGVVEVELS